MNSYQRAVELMQQRGIVITKITAIIIRGNGDRYEQDVKNPFIYFCDAFPPILTTRSVILHWSNRAWEDGVQVKPKTLAVGDL